MVAVHMSRGRAASRWSGAWAKRRLTDPVVNALWDRYEHLPIAWGISIYIASGLGVVLLLGGSARVSAPGFATIRALGGWPTWGALFLAMAALLAVGRALGPRWLGRAFWVGAFLYSMLAVAFLVAASQSGGTAFTGPVAYSGIALMNVNMAMAYRRAPSVVLRD